MHRLGNGLSLRSHELSGTSDCDVFRGLYPDPDRVTTYVHDRNLDFVADYDLLIFLASND